MQKPNILSTGTASPWPEAWKTVYDMNSVFIINWVDKEFIERMRYTLQRAGYLVAEDYEGIGTKTIVCVKAPKAKEPGSPVGLDRASGSAVVGGSALPNAPASGKAT